MLPERASICPQRARTPIRKNAYRAVSRAPQPNRIERGARRASAPKLQVNVSNARLATVTASACVKPHRSCHAKNFFCAAEYFSRSFHPPAPSQSSVSNTMRARNKPPRRICHINHCVNPAYAFGLKICTRSGWHARTRAIRRGGMNARGAMATFSIRTPSSSYA